MGCIETKRTPPPVVIPTSTVAPIYVKSALKNSRGNIKGRSQRLSDSNREIPTVNKSVNFDEKVEVKLRTPTPKLMEYDTPPSSPTMPTRRRLSNNNDDDDDIDSIHSSISSQEDFKNGKLKTSPLVSSFPTLQRNHSNISSWHRSNSISVIPSMNNTNEKHPPPPLAGIQQPPPPSGIQQPPPLRGMQQPPLPGGIQQPPPPGGIQQPPPPRGMQQPPLPAGMQQPPPPRGMQQPPINMNSYPTENPIMPRGKTFKVLRKTSYPVLPESPPEPSYQPTVQLAPVPVKRPLPNPNAVFVEHQPSFPENELPTLPVYYSFSRRPKINTDLTEN